jgi:hypothetical protein
VRSLAAVSLASFASRLWLLSLTLALGCARTAPTAPPPQAGNARVVWTYDVHAVGPLGDALTVVADFAPGAADSFAIDDDATGFVRDVQVRTGDGYRPVLRQGAGWTLPCQRAGCRIRYTFALGEAAEQADDVDTAIAAGGVIIAPPSTWLLRPSGSRRNGRFRFTMHTEAGNRFASGVSPAPGGAHDTFEADTSEMDAASFCAFGPIRSKSIRNGTAEVDVALAPQGLAIDADNAIAWIATAVNNIAAYYRVFAVHRTLVIVVPGKRGNAEGLTLGDGGPAVVLRAGPGLTNETSRDDWVATHELLHVTLPSLSRNHSWLSEGIATYVEPVVRARAGIVTPERFWGDLVKGLPQGLPVAGDEGLERTHTWGRTYWGGALFCFVADLRVRELTRGRHSFDDALRGIVATGADVQSHWEIDHFLEVGDRATGTAVLADLYREMGLGPATVDLAAIWSRLGIRVRDDRVTFDDAAPLASLRRAITDARANN